MHFKREKLTGIGIKQDMIHKQKWNLNSSANNRTVGSAKREYGLLNLPY